MKNLRSKIALAAFCLGGCSLLVGCGTLFDSGAIAGPGQPSPAFVAAVRETSKNFGTVGELIGGAIIVGAQAAAYLRAKRALSRHEEEYHSVPLGNLAVTGRLSESGAASRDRPGDAQPGPVT
jgi:hypothetical protein